MCLVSLVKRTVKVVSDPVRFFLLPEHKIVCLGVFWLARIGMAFLGVLWVRLVQYLFDVFLPSLHHNISGRFQLNYRRGGAVFPISIIGWRRRLHSLQWLNRVCCWTLIVVSLLSVLAFVVWMCWAFDFHEKFYFNVIKFFLCDWQDYIILLKDYLKFVAVVTFLVHVVEDFVLLSDQKCPFDLWFTLLLVEHAFGIWWLEEVVELLGGDELLEWYLFGWWAV